MHTLSEHCHSLKSIFKTFFLIGSLLFILNCEYQASVPYFQPTMTTIKKESFRSNTQMIEPSNRTKTGPINKLIVQASMHLFILLKND